MKTRCFHFAVLLLICFSIPLAATAQTVDIPDFNLRTKIEVALNKQAGDPITAAEMATLTRLEVPNANISDLTGIEHATNLKSLNLGVEFVVISFKNSNSISDLSPLEGLTNLTKLNLSGNGLSDVSALVPVLSGLTNLRWLVLGNNSISDISALSGLTNLSELDLGDNSISDISAVAGLTNLTRLDLAFNSISDISAVADLTNLTGLELAFNSISDISAVADLTNLIWLELSNNSISDISPLVANTGLGSGDTVDLKRNPLSYPSIHTHIPTLQERRVQVAFDGRTPTALLKISGDNQQGASGTVLANPLTVEVRDENGSVFEGVPMTFTVTAGSGTLSTQSTTTNPNGRAESTLTLGPNLGTNTVEVSASEIERSVTFNSLSDIKPPPIVADVNSDGVVNILDLVLVASDFGNEGPDLVADVNRDAVVNILDLVLVAGAFGNETAAPLAPPQ